MKERTQAPWPQWEETGWMANRVGWTIPVQAWCGEGGMCCFCDPGAFSQVASRTGSKDTVMAKPDSSAIVQYPSYRQGPSFTDRDLRGATDQLQCGDLNPG